MILEPLGHSLKGNDIDSTNELLYKVNELNKELNDEEFGVTTVEKNFVEGSIGPVRATAGIQLA